MKVDKKKLKRIIIQEMKRELENQSDEVADIKQRVHSLWEDFQNFNTHTAEPKIQNLATDIDRLQIPWDKSGRLKERLYELKYEFTQLIQDINQYKSYFEETLQSEEMPDVDEYEDGHYKVNRGGDYYAT